MGHDPARGSDQVNISKTPRVEPGRDACCGGDIKVYLFLAFCFLNDGPP